MAGIYRLGEAQMPEYHGIDEYTKLMLHGDGADNGTNITDEMGKTITRAGNVCTKTAIKKFGTASIYFDGTGDFLTCGGGTDFAFGTGDFTIDFQYKPLSSAEGMIYDSRPASTNGLYLSIFKGTDDKVVVFVNASIRIQGSQVLLTNQFYHIAVIKSLGATKLYVNGTQDGSSYTDTNDYLNGASRPVIGANGWTTSASNLNGYIDELRVSKGIARWTANFTPSTVAYAVTTYTHTNANVQIKSQYRGLSGVNREIKAQYRGYSGVNRLVFGSNKTYLYNSGTFDDISGFNLVKYGSTASSLTLDASDLHYALAGNGSQACILKPYTTTTVDLTNYTKLCFESTFTNTGSIIMFHGIYATTPPATDDESGMVAKTEQTANGVTEVDISAITGNYYIGSRLRCDYTSGYNLQLYVTKIWLE